MRSVVLVLLLAVSSFGAVIYSDNFDGSLPATSLNANVPGWDELNGTVDYLKGYPGISCRGNTGGCIDLDGSTGSAADFRSSTVFNLLAGNIYTLSYSFSGSQRNGLNSMTVSFGGETNTHTNIDAFAPYTMYSISVTPLANTTSQILFSHAGGDNIGLVLDDVRVDESAVVPEPSAILLACGGLGALLAFRKRK
jgi:hypothetical protein